MKYRLEIFKENKWFRSSLFDLGTVYALHRLFIKNRKQNRKSIPKHRIQPYDDEIHTDK